MNFEPYKNITLVLLGSIGTYFVNKGWLTNEQWVSLSGALVTIVGIAWAVYKGKQSTMIAATAALPKVEKIETNDLKLAIAAPDNVTPSVNAR